MNFYALLGVPADADEAAIRSAYRVLARRYHPDSGEGSSPEKFRQVVEAYEILGDSQRRQSYDVSLQQARSLAKPVAEPLTRRAEPLYQENWNAFEMRFGSIYETSDLFYDPSDLFDELTRFIDAEFFGDMY
jgi:curved DNA-binding protein CbpA